MALSVSGLNFAMMETARSREDFLALSIKAAEEPRVLDAARARS
jgi:hypothetical protein